MSNILDPDQAQHFIGPDPGPNCLQRLSADDTGRLRVNGDGESLVEAYTEDLSINGLVTDGNTKLCSRGITLAVFQSTAANKIDS